jgi:5-(carboxyamino)imidazole ribonucleotide synthase
VNQSTHGQSIRCVGVIGGGQLAWMIATAAQNLGIQLTIQTSQATDPAIANFASSKQNSLPPQAILAALDDLSATKQLAAASQVITFENEFVDLPALRSLQAQGVCFRPNLDTLEPLLDKYDQRCYLQQIGLPVPRFAKITPETNLQELNFGWPLVIKRRRLGYDGQGTFILQQPADWLTFWQQVKVQPAEADNTFLAEEFIPFQQELAIMAARSVSGELSLYPVVETQQQQQVCRRVLVPAAIDAGLEQQIQAIANQFLSALDAVGIFGLELFLTSESKVLINEVAPRTHNSGHFTLDACLTSQFEQHLRAICGLPLGSSALICPGAVMVNLLGFERAQSDYWEKRQQLAAIPQAHVYWYGKTQSSPGRKLGHVTVLLTENNRAQALEVAAQVEALWYGS